MTKKQIREAAHVILTSDDMTGRQRQAELPTLNRLKTDTINAYQMYWLIEALDSHGTELEGTSDLNKPAQRVLKEADALMEQIAIFKHSISMFYHALNPDYTPPNNPKIQKWVSEVTRFLNSEDVCEGTGDGFYTPHF